MLSIRAARIIARISSSVYILEFEVVGSGTVASKSFRAGRPAGPVLIMMLGKFLGDSFKFVPFLPRCPQVVRLLDYYLRIAWKKWAQQIRT